MATTFSYELRQRPAGRGWGVYATENFPNAQAEQMLQAFFATELRLSDLPPTVPWLGAVQMASGDWLFVWHGPGEQRISGVLISSAEYQAVGGDALRVLIRADRAFAQTNGLLNPPVEWKGAEPSGGEKVPLVSTRSGYLPEAVGYFRRLRQTRGVDRGWATSWLAGTVRPSWLKICPFEVAEGGAAVISKPASKQSVERPREERAPPAATSNSETSRLSALDATVQRLRARIEQMEAAGRAAPTRGTVPPPERVSDLKSLITITASAFAAALASLTVHQCSSLHTMLHSAASAAERHAGQAKTSADRSAAEATKAEETAEKSARDLEAIGKKHRDAAQKSAESAKREADRASGAVNALGSSVEQAKEGIRKAGEAAAASAKGFSESAAESTRQTDIALKEARDLLAQLPPARNVPAPAAPAPAEKALPDSSATPDPKNKK